mmetsp:Transcript_24098/g.50548  ORF Transcript_24098/g.50548 Transcript_24098/m.50548 type:complete len:810 (-) Transcript_24098:302-2731(-)
MDHSCSTEDMLPFSPATTERVSSSSSDEGHGSWTEVIEPSDAETERASPTYAPQNIEMHGVPRANLQMPLAASTQDHTMPLVPEVSPLAPAVDVTKDALSCGAEGFKIEAEQQTTSHKEPRLELVDSWRRSVMESIARVDCHSGASNIAACSDSDDAQDRAVGCAVYAGCQGAGCMLRCCVKQQSESDEEWASRPLKRRRNTSSIERRDGVPQRRLHERIRPGDATTPGLLVTASTESQDGALALGCAQSGVETQTWRCLTRRFSCDGIGSNRRVSSLLRKLEKFELAVQGDDYADTDRPSTNHEALSYARAAAVVLSLDWSIEDALAECERRHALHRGSTAITVAQAATDFAATYGGDPATTAIIPVNAPTAATNATTAAVTTSTGATTTAVTTATATVERCLRGEPFIGAFRASQIVQLARTGTCEALRAFEADEAPLDSTGARRRPTSAGRTAAGAAAKLRLSRILGLSSLRAGALYDHLPLGPHGQRLSKPVRTIDELRMLSHDELRVLSSSSGARGFKFGLEHHEQLQAELPMATAREVLCVVRQTVRFQASERARLQRDCADDVQCECCWHAEFVGGARRRGTPGHDCDILLWHRREAASWGEGEACVLYPLLRALERAGRLVPATNGWQMVSLHHAKRLPLRGRRDGSVLRQHQRLTRPVDGAGGGFENLSFDRHDRAFCVWRGHAGALHRIDLIVCATPEELPFARIAWTGSRLLNRLMRTQAHALGLTLNAHGLFNNGTRGGVDGRILVHLDARAGSTASVAKLQPVPYDLISSEEAVIRVLARGTEAFADLYNPLNRNA